MQTVFRLAYSLVVALLFVLFVILGTRTFYGEPKAPQYPAPLYSGPLLKCDFQAQMCYQSPSGPVSTPEEQRPLTLEEARRLYPDAVKAQEEADQAGRDYAALLQRYQDDRVDYRRNVFILASVLGVVAVSVAPYLFRRVDAMPLGLLLGGIGVVIFGWIQAAGDFGEIGSAPLFAVVSAGLGVVLAAGYRFLGSRPGPAGNGG